MTWTLLQLGSFKDVAQIQCANTFYTLYTSINKLLNNDNKYKYIKIDIAKDDHFSKSKMALSSNFVLFAYLQFIVSINFFDFI